MKLIFSSVVAAFLSIALPALGVEGAKENIRFTDFVNPYIGTGDHGHVFFGANVPFGLVQLGPSQKTQAWDWCSGYHYSDTTLYGFSHTHLSGTGIGDLGDITFMPLVNPADTAASFSRIDEKCRPGYYSVKIKESGIGVELTATQRTGYHKYTFPKYTPKEYVKIDLGYGIGWDRPVETQFYVKNDSTVEGYRFSKGWANDQKIYFTAVFSSPFEKCTVSEKGKRGSEAILEFAGLSGKPLEVKVGLSPVSVGNARMNLASENPGWNFDDTFDKADCAWNGQLSKIKVETPSKTDLRKFYTALYHTMFAPAVFNDVNGDYRGADGVVRNTGGNFTNYTIFSLWDTYRAAHPLSTLISPELQGDYAGTFLNIFKEQGKLPVWHLHGNETNCMIGNPGVIVLGDLILKGFVKNPEEAYVAMKESMLRDERSLKEIKEYGYVPYDADGGEESVAKGMEYAVADAAVAKVASYLGHEEDAVYFAKRGKAYAEYFDKESRFMRGKSKSGEFRDEVFNPFAASHRADDYCEGNAWQYVWMVPHDPHGLISLFDSEKQFTVKLDSLFTVEGKMGDEASPDISGLIGQYAHGNEPGHHTVYLYDYAGMPWKSAPILREIMDNLYQDAPAGLCGNEDVGQMSAWFVLSSMGLYQVEPTGGRFVFGSPLFDSASIDLGDGKVFTVKTVENGKDRKYIQSAKLNGKPYGKSYIDFEDIKKGGILELTMGKKPSKTFGSKSVDRP